MYIFIDESGTLPDPKDKYIVICAVVVRELAEGQNIISRVLEALRQTRKPLREVKYYYSGANTKRQFLSGMVAAGFKIFALVVDKKDRKIADKPSNFSLLVAELIDEIWFWQNTDTMHIVLDKHFSRKVDQDKFDAALLGVIHKNIPRPIQVSHADSQDNLLVNIADMAAGSVLWKYTSKDMQFYNIIKENIIVEKIVSWPEIKGKYTNKKLT